MLKLHCRASFANSNREPEIKATVNACTQLLRFNFKIVNVIISYYKTSTISFEVSNHY